MSSSTHVNIHNIDNVDNIDNIDNINNTQDTDTLADTVTLPSGLILPSYSFLTSLNLSSNKLSHHPQNPPPNEVNFLHLTPNLVTLDLAANFLASISPLTSSVKLPNLTKLVLSYNNLTSFSGLSLFAPNVEDLDVKGNNVKDPAAIVQLSSCKRIRILTMQTVEGGCSNPVCSSPSYTSAVVASCPFLTTLDGHPSTKHNEFGLDDDTVDEIINAGEVEVEEMEFDSPKGGEGGREILGVSPSLMPRFEKASERYKRLKEQKVNSESAVKGTAGGSDTQRQQPVSIKRIDQLEEQMKLLSA
eukprot:CAMPEP_0118643108 /NCGR_PEP_ID=MMETSP0785-20121206/6214_1 /TAXON_ID=91992 /ORGANISM="Bolidomonas pacifica, Strain CCMP 1866" /LENGTH=301 /DNA_ID=CAMNT_0006534747 /DNA_START=302 /DNA_END=1202 /DNA_ORIENTATION=+